MLHYKLHFFMIWTCVSSFDELNQHLSFGLVGTPHECCTFCSVQHCRRGHIKGTVPWPSAMYIGINTLHILKSISWTWLGLNRGPFYWQPPALPSEASRFDKLKKSSIFQVLTLRGQFYKNFYTLVRCEINSLDE